MSFKDSEDFRPDDMWWIRRSRAVFPLVPPSFPPVPSSVLWENRMEGEGGKEGGAEPATCIKEGGGGGGWWWWNVFCEREETEEE